MKAQIIYIVLIIIELMIVSYKHGKPRDGKHNVFITMTSLFLLTLLLYNGGFFNPLFN